MEALAVPSYTALLQGAISSCAPFCQSITSPELQPHAWQTWDPVPTDTVPSQQHCRCCSMTVPEELLVWLLDHVASSHQLHTLVIIIIYISIYDVSIFISGYWIVEWIRTVPVLMFSYTSKDAVTLLLTECLAYFNMLGAHAVETMWQMCRA